MAVDKTGGRDKDKALIRRIRENHDPEALDQLFEKYRPFLHGFANRYKSRLLSYEDAYQVAALGLMKALERFDPDKGARLITFAYPTVDGELKKHYRDCVEIVRIPRRLRDLRRRIVKVKEKLIAEGKKEPTKADIARELDADGEEVMEALASLQDMHILSLDTSYPSSEPGCELLSVLGGNDPALEKKEREVTVKRAMDKLPPTMQVILEYRLKGWTQKKIARSMDLSQMHVSRLERKAVDEMRRLCGS